MVFEVINDKGHTGCCYDGRVREDTRSLLSRSIVAPLLRYGSRRIVFYHIGCWGENRVWENVPPTASVACCRTLLTCTIS